MEIKIRKEMNFLMDKSNRMGVYVLVSHLVITLAVLVLYGITLFQSNESETLKGLLYVIMGYWFGAITKDSLKSAEKISTQVTENTQNTIEKDDKNEIK